KTGNQVLGGKGSPSSYTGMGRLSTRLARHWRGSAYLVRLGRLRAKTLPQPNLSLRVEARFHSRGLSLVPIVAPQKLGSLYYQKPEAQFPRHSQARPHGSVPSEYRSFRAFRPESPERDMVKIKLRVGR
ncbi:hypothetical protein S245_062478, partial [Arachis hypogaea]